VVDGSSSDECNSQKSSGSYAGSQAGIKITLGADAVSAIKRADEEEAEEISCSVQMREKEDRSRLAGVRTLFYSLNERFEHLLKFKPIRKVNLWSVEMNVEVAQGVMDTFRLSEETESLDEQVKTLEHQLDLRDYYDIKRPCAVFFSQSKASTTVTVSRFDLLCEKGNGPGFHEGSVSQATVLAGRQAHNLKLKECRAITHPANNSVFLIQGGTSQDCPQ